MTIKANGTVAKDIALYFLDVTQERYTKSMIVKSIQQAKSLLQAGYTKEEIIDVIDYITTKTSTDMYSLGYVSSCINDILKKIKEDNLKLEVEEIIKKGMEELTATKEGVINDESKERNRRKIEGFGVESRFGEKYNLDMLKE